MSVSTAKSMILKAQDNLDIAQKSLNDESQHDIVGYNLAQACELYLKAMMSLRDLEFPEGEDAHDLDYLMTTLEEEGFAEISSHADVIELTQYNNPSAHIRKDERLDLDEYLGYVNDLKKLVGEQLKLF
ncbi:HEPN domain-containing protein [Bdellovibrio sp. SKB1291214]|uniref:HEPN domain-containing protein n=1 Tax=Bdellovibrio sp. SKB1291214 TaxID=1732569 RepID=UPI0020CC54F0|nr:HEPN domain-containing protein [Bdellovibrio sp. SKB1291214]UYL09018.1 HEPN domain-containing protein [Bdellovibrio sp. SKB1291214]